MTKKKVILSICALVLVCVISVSGTLAYLSLTTEKEPVVNTFIAAGGGKLIADGIGKFTLTESEARPAYTNSGVYVLYPESQVKENEYKVLPGTTVPKDPSVTIEGKTSVPAYLYVEIVDNTNGVIGWEVTKDWMLLSGVIGNNGGKVYVWNGGKLAATDDLRDYDPIYILNNNAVTISDNVDTLGTLGSPLTFYAYLAQTQIGDKEPDADIVYRTVFQPTLNPGA